MAAKANLPKNEPQPYVRPTRVALDPKQAKAWDLTRTKLSWVCPAFTHVFYQMMVNGKDMALFTKDVPIAATDGASLMINPDTFFNYTLDERVFICAHEILHGIFNHCVMLHNWQRSGEVKYPDGTRLPYVHVWMNIAMDLVINDILVSSGVGAINKDWLHDTSTATKMDSVVEAYRKVFKQNGKGGGGVQFDVHLAPGSSQGQDPQSAANARNEQQWKQEVAAAVESARIQGRMPFGLDRILGEILEPKVDWTEKIRALMARKLGSGRRSWRRLDRRLIVQEIYAPGKTGFGCGDVVVACDTSGSIDYESTSSRPSTGDVFLAEVAGILEDCRPKRLFLMWCDAKVHRVDELEEVSELNAVRHKGAPGGGGTSFIPVFDMINKMGIEPDALVYLTDGIGSFPGMAPKYPVIWGSIYETSKYPFGDVVNIPKQA